MKKKSLVTMVVSLSLVAVTGVGATLAFLSDSTGTLVNSFSTATGYTGEDQAVQIQETKLGTEKKYSYGQDGFTGNEYTDLLPGDSVKKDPNVVLGENSIDSYVFIQVVGADDLANTDNDGDLKGDFSIDEFNTKWEKVGGPEDSLDGYYIYNVGTEEDPYKVVAGTSTEDLFTTVTYNKNVTVDEAVDLPVIQLTAYAVQYKNVSKDEAVNLVVYGNPAVISE